jgi:hypothetical protein
VWSQPTRPAAHPTALIVASGGVPASTWSSDFALFAVRFSTCTWIVA